jgi:subtilisin family serine protease
VQLQEVPLARSPRAVRSAVARSGRAPKLDFDALDSRRELDRLRSGQEAALAAIGDTLGRPAAPRARYSVAFNGFALEMTPEEAEALAALPGVARVHLASRLKIASDAGPAWSGAPGLWDGTATGGPYITQGEGIVIGVIDTGIDLTHPSFADIGGEGYNHVNPRGSGNYVGWCNPSHPSYSASLPCNDKLIGVWSWPDSGNDPRDDHGHGTHTASIAAGNHTVANLAGGAVVRTVSGVAPHANLITYDACEFDGYCYAYALIEAIEQAVVDGVDVISMSITDYGYSPWSDPVAEALLNARASGIFAAAALSDPYEIGSPGDAPWVLGVGATSHHRRFSSQLAGLSGGVNPPGDLQGNSLTGSYGPAPLVDAGTLGDYDCSSPFAPGTLSGKIVVCRHDGWTTEQAIGQNVLAGGAGGLILASYSSYYTPGDPVASVLPSVRLYGGDGYELLYWLTNGSGARTGRIVGTTVEESASFADRLWIGSPTSSGFYNEIQDFVKPDVAAPGEGILAAHTDPGRFRVLSGTSMAAAHAAGAAALLIDLHPDWTPAEIHSALQMTGVPVTGKDGNTGFPATPAEVGGGRIDLRSVARVGLVLDETAQSFAAVDPWLGGDPSTLNLAGLAHDRCVLSCGWTRRMRSTRTVPTQWTVTVENPAGVALTVQPSSFTLAPGATQTLQITAAGSTSTEGMKTGRVILTEAGAQAPVLHLPLVTWWAPHYGVTVQNGGLGSGRVTSAPGGIDCGADCHELYPGDSSVVLTAAPDPGSVFVGWGGACYDVEPTCALSVYGPRVVVAYFSPPSPDRPLDNNVPVKGLLNGPVGNGTWSYYFLDVEAGTSQLVVDLFDLDGDANLYLRSGAKPTLDFYTCVDYDYYGTTNRRCVITQPAAGRWWVGINNEDEDVDIHYALRASWGASFDRELANHSPVDDFQVASVRGGTWKYYFIDVEAGSSDLRVALANLSADADLYVRQGSKPDRSNHVCSSTEASTLPEACNVANPAPGRWWVGVNNFAVGTISYRVRADWRTTDVATDFYSVAPCRLFDSRSGQPLATAVSRSIPVHGLCGIPATARAVSVIVTVANPTGIGRVVLYPGDEGQPNTSTVNFQTGQNKANNALLKLGGGALAAWAAVNGNGQVHLIVDVNGYFE